MARLVLQKHLGAFLCCLALFLACAPNSAAGIILTNGSFEATGAEYGSGLFAATGWTNNSGLNIQASSAPAGFESTDPAGVTGSRYLRLVTDGSDPSDIGFIVQDLGTMVAGQTYSFTGDVLGGEGNVPWGATVELTSDGSLSPATVYRSQTLSGYAVGAVGVGALQVSYTATSLDNGNELFLWLEAASLTDGEASRGGIDNIQLTTTTPEPGGVALFSVGLVALGILRKRR